MKTQNQIAARLSAKPWPALFCSALFGLSACMQNPTEIDGTDYSQSAVTAEIAGQSLAASFASTQDWDKTAANSVDLKVMESVFGSTTQLKAQTGMPKMSAKSADDMVIEIDTTSGMAHLTHTTQILGTTTVEKVDLLWDDLAKDAIKDNEHIVRYSVKKTSLLGKVESAVFIDGDDDGIINAVNAKSKVQITFEKTEGTQVETAVLVAGCGPDLNFDNDSDNQIFQATWNRMVNKVLQAEASFQDGDDDGIIVDNADTSVVVVEMGDFEPMDRPLVKERHAHAKVRLFGKDKGDEPLAFGYTETMKSGRVNTVSMKNRFGKEDLIPNDTMTVRLETVAKRDEDTLKTLSIEFVMNPGPDLKSENDDSAYAFHIYSTKHIGFEREAEFHFYADTPVLHGEEPTAGHFDGKATYANGKTATLKGEFSPKGFSAEYIGPEEGKWTVDYNLAGKLIP